METVYRWIWCSEVVRIANGWIFNWMSFRIDTKWIPFGLMSISHWLNNTPRVDYLLTYSRIRCLLAVFVSYLPTKANRVFSVARCRPCLGWLYLLVLVAAFPTEHPRTTGSSWVIQFLLSRHINRPDASNTVWFIKWQWNCDIFNVGYNKYLTNLQYNQIYWL